MNWRSVNAQCKIEAQIAELRKPLESPTVLESLKRLPLRVHNGRRDAADTMQALLDVAVAAEEYLADHHNDSEQALFDALDKLWEVGDV